MRKLIFIIILAFHLVAINSSYTQTGWIQQQSGLSLTLNSVYFVNQNTGWVCGDSGNIIKTTNGGINWISQSSSTLYPLMSVFFINENTGWCSGGTADFNFFVNRKIVTKTTNGGENWYTAYFENSAWTRFGEIYFTDEFHGCVAEQGGTGSGTAGAIHKTSNGGLSWQYTYVGPYFRDLQLTDQSTGYSLSQYADDTGHDTAYIYRTTDGGSSWNGIFKRNMMVFFSNSFLDNNTGWISARDLSTSTTGKILKTTDGGSNFTIFDISIYLEDIIFLDNNNGWGCQNRVYRTIDGGENWTMQLGYVGYNYNSIYFTDSLNGWVVGTNGAIFSTSTGGINSINYSQSNQPLKFSLSQNYPNPFNPSTKLEFGISDLGFVTLKVYDILGNEVKTLVIENKPAGRYTVTFDGSNLSSGIYFYKLTTGNFTETKSMLLLK